MKTKLTYFILGLVMTLFLSATVAEELLTVKPAKPSHTVAYCGQDPHEFTIKYAQKGYVVISSAAQGYYNTYVVMGKFN